MMMPVGQRWKLHHGDCLEVMRSMPDASVHSVVTDPPYGLAFMGKKWDYDVPMVEFWAECLRVLKPGGHLLAFAGTRTQHRMCCRIEDAGFEIRDMIAWVYAQGFPKSHNLDGQWQGWGTALKPALEPVTVARKPLDGTVAANVIEHGCGAINIEACRIPTNGETPTGSGSDAGWCISTPGGNGGNVTPPSGRWPANLIHDGSDEVVRGFPHSGNGKGTPTIAKRQRNKGWCKSSPGGGVDGIDNYGDSGSAARFFYSPKASKADREDGLDGFDMRPNKRNTHPTVKPTDLMRYLCRLVTPPGGIVLDPFMGSGSTGKAAVLEGFRFIGIEREVEYVAIAKARLEHAEQELGVFA